MLFHHLIKIIPFFVLIISKTVLFCVVASYTESRRALKLFVSTKKWENYDFARALSAPLHC